MRWNYNPEYRQLFTKDGGVHCDILIVPHATNVTPNEGGPPTVTSKVPVFEKNQAGESIPQRGQYQDVQFMITNEDIIQEKFEYTYAINSADTLTFSSAESACLKFSIRNLKDFIIDNEETGEGHYESCIPNLQKFEVRDEVSGDIVVGEIETRTIIKLYMYYEGDSSTMIYMGMFIVEEDKASDDGYQRDITAYDFMATLRDMDIYEWYKRLFKGVHKTDPKTGEEIENSYWPGLVGKDEWTIKDALNDLFNNLATFDPNRETVTNPSEYLRDYESDEYGGYGMPIMLDPDLFDDTKEYHIPEEAGDENDQYECYGYMSILELPFRCDESIIRSGSLSLGKFLEDIGTLAGRYPCIRIDKIQDGNYWDGGPNGQGPEQNPDIETLKDEDHPWSNYMLYERCILTFKPLPRKDAKIAEENSLDESEIAKGFKADYFNVQSIMYLELYNREDKEAMIKYGNLTKQQRKDMENGFYMPSFIITDNTFSYYLTINNEKLDKEVKERYKWIVTALADDKSAIDITIDPDENPETENETVTLLTGEGYLHDAYKNMKYREYTPCEITTPADPCRDVGDRIEVTTVDRITGEKRTFETYILERKLSGIQAMMDTYTAKGNINGGGFSDYRSGTKSGSSYAPQTFGYNGYGSNNSTGGSESGKDKTSIVQNITGLTNEDFVEIIRNIGFRLLEEPTKVSVEYGVTEIDPSEIFSKMHYPPLCDLSDPSCKYSFLECLTPLTDGCDTNPITLSLYDVEQEQDVEIEYTAKKYDTIPATENHINVLYTFGKDKKWHRVENDETYKDYGQHPLGDYVYNTIQSGDKDEKIDYYYYDENDKIIKGTIDVNEGMTVGDSTYVYPGYWWKAWKFDMNFSGEDDGMFIHSNYYGNLENQNGYTNPPGMNELNTRTVSGEGSDHLVTGLTDESSQNPLVYISSTGDIYSYVRSYCVIPYNEDTSAGTYEGYYIYGSDDKWHLHTKNCIGDTNDGDTVPTDIETGDTIQQITINGEPVEVGYGDYFIRKVSGTDTYYSYNYPGCWWVSTSDKIYPTDEVVIPVLASSKPSVFLKWTDPDDITTNRPVPCAWAGTIVVRKEGSPPRHRWDGVKVIKDVKTRNKYKKKALVDDTVKINKKYYYGIFPYHLAEDGKYHYRFTKVVSVNTKKIIDAPIINDIDYASLSDWDGSEIDILWSGNNNKMTVRIESDVLVFAFYTGATKICETTPKAYNTSTSYYTAVSDPAKVHIAFLKDDVSQVAKPSFVCEQNDSTKYTYNSEELTNSEMCAIYDWLTNA